MTLPVVNLSRVWAAQIGRLGAGRRICGLAALLALVLAPGVAPATVVTLGFDNISNNSVANAAAGEAQLFVDVSNEGVGANQVKFIFRNTGPAASSIADLYWDSGPLASIAGIINGPGTNFSVGASPSNLPAGQNASPPFSADFSADSNPPVQPNGVNPGETVAVKFYLKSGKTFSDVLAALGNGSLRVGIHVQGFADGGSESFVNTGTPTAVPEPGTAVLLGLGGIGLLAARARRRLSPTANSA